MSQNKEKETSKERLNSLYQEFCGDPNNQSELSLIVGLLEILLREMENQQNHSHSIT